MFGEHGPNIKVTVFEKLLSIKMKRITYSTPCDELGGVLGSAAPQKSESS